MTRIYILVEGQTEETFVNNILRPSFLSKNIQLTPIINKTKRTHSGHAFRGGVTPYPRVKKELLNLLADRGAFVTTMIDYYALPDSFPGKAELEEQNFRQAEEKVEFLERKLADDINNTRFVAYYSLHEFESLLFAAPEAIASTLSKDLEPRLNSIRQSFSSPEHINDQPSTCPSARLSNLYPGYQKPLHGSLISKKCGLDTIRNECLHFHQWLVKLEQL